MYSTRLIVLPVAALLAGAGIAFGASRGSGPGHPSARDEVGRESCASALEADVCTWVVTDGAEVTELGATIPMRLIESVPLDAEMVWPPEALLTVTLPESARSRLGVDHMTVNWEAHGHPPASFMAQHFDFHFYTVSQEEVGTIDCSDATKPRDVPAGYDLPDIEVPGMGTLVGLCVPHMGMHAMPAPDVSASDPFEASMMLGYYGGRAIFFEPMVSRSVLLERKGFELAVPAVSVLPAGVRYPTHFRAEFDAANDSYRFVFSGFGSE